LDGAVVTDAFAQLRVENVEDVDMHAVTYEFLVTSDAEGLSPYDGASQLPEGGGGETAWTMTRVRSGDVFWKARATDELGLFGDWSETRLLRVSAGDDDDDDDEASAGDDDVSDDDSIAFAAAPGCALNCGTMAGGRAVEPRSMACLLGLIGLGWARRRPPPGARRGGAPSPPSPLPAPVGAGLRPRPLPSRRP
jgi:hypothetical protein